MLQIRRKMLSAMLDLIFHDYDPQGMQCNSDCLYHCTTQCFLNAQCCTTMREVWLRQSSSNVSLPHANTVAISYRCMFFKQTSFLFPPPKNNRTLDMHSLPNAVRDRQGHWYNTYFTGFIYHNPKHVGGR